MSLTVGNSSRAVERRIINRGDGGSIPSTAVLKLRQFRSPHICLCFSEGTLKAGGPFYLVSMPGEVKDPTQGKCVTCSVLTNSREKDNFCVNPSLGCLEENHLRPISTNHYQIWSTDL